MPGGLCALPLELVHHILSSLDAFALVRCRKTCKLLCSAIDSSIHATYSMDLARNGLHGDVTTPDIRKRVDILRRWKAGWGKPATEQHQLYLLDGPTWELYGNVLATEDESLNMLKFTRLPSPTVTTSALEDTWSIPISDITVLRDFSMDPSQDLLVLLEIISTGQVNNDSDVRTVYRFHVRTMSTGQVHPVARAHVVEVKSLYDVDDEAGYSIQISGDYLGCLIIDTPWVVILAIHNWKTGMVHFLVQDMTCVLLSFAFLNDTHIIVTTVQGFPLVVDFSEADGSKTYPNCTSIGAFVSLGLPILEEDCACDIRCDPSYSWPNNASSVPFFDDPEQVIYTVRLWPIEDDDPWLFVVPRKTLLSVLQQADGVAHAHTQLPWELWGVTGTRIFHPACYDLISDVWTCHTFGSTMVLIDKKKQFASIYDFNKMRVQEEIRKGTTVYTMPHRLPQHTGEGAGPVLVCTQDIQTHITGYGLQTNVESMLPFRVRPFALPPHSEDEVLIAMMYSQDCIIAVHETDESTIRFDIRHFEI